MWKFSFYHCIIVYSIRSSLYSFNTIFKQKKQEQILQIQWTKYLYGINSINHSNKIQIRLSINLNKGGILKPRSHYLDSLSVFQLFIHFIRPIHPQRRRSLLIKCQHLARSRTVSALTNANFVYLRGVKGLWRPIKKNCHYRRHKYSSE